MGCSTSKEGDTHSKDEKRKRRGTGAGNNSNQQQPQFINPAADATSESTAPPSLTGGDSSTATPLPTPLDDMPFNPHGQSSRNPAVRNPLLSSPQHHTLEEDEPPALYVAHPPMNNNSNIIMNHGDSGEDEEVENAIGSDGGTSAPPSGATPTTNSIVVIHGINSFTNNNSSTALEFDPMSPFSRAPTRTNSSATTTTTTTMTKSDTTTSRSKCSSSFRHLNLLLGGSNSHPQEDGTLSMCSQEQQVVVGVVRNNSSVSGEQADLNQEHGRVGDESVNIESGNSFPLLGLGETAGGHQNTSGSSSRLRQQLTSKKTFSLGDRSSTRVTSLTSTPSPSALSSRTPPPCRSLGEEEDVAFQIPNAQQFNTHSQLSVHGLVPPMAAGKGTATETSTSPVANVVDSPPLPTLTPPLKQQDHQTAMAAAVAAQDRLLHVCLGGRGSGGGSSSYSAGVGAADRGGSSSSSALILRPRSTSSSW